MDIPYGLAAVIGVAGLIGWTWRTLASRVNSVENILDDHTERLARLETKVDILLNGGRAKKR